MFLAIMVTAVLAGPPARQQTQSAVLQQASWLAGCWELRATNRVTLEMWMPPAGAVMLGGSRTIASTTTPEYEHLRLSVDGNRIVYTAVPSGQRETSFPSVHVSDTALVFENSAHDFPQRIIYRRGGADSLLARIEGPGPTGPRGIDFPMRRVSCTTAGPPLPPPDTLVIGADLSRDGRRLAIARGAPPNFDVHIADLPSGSVHAITDHAAVDYQPKWSPDGSRLAIVSVRDGHQEIYTIHPDGSTLRQLTKGAAHNSEPVWSPDGTSIAFRSERNGNPDIHVMSADGSAQRQLTSSTVAEVLPAWAPDGTRLLFIRSVAGHAEVHVMNADGSAVRQLTMTPAGHSRPASWSPDGRLIAFGTNRDGNDEVYIMNADGTGARNLSNHAAVDSPIGWSADGAWILFLSTRDRRGRDVYRMRPDGADVTRLTITR